MLNARQKAQDNCQGYMEGLYQLDYKINHERVNVDEKSYTKEGIWHKRYGHLGLGNLQKLTCNNFSLILILM